MHPSAVREYRKQLIRELKQEEKEKQKAYQRSIEKRTPNAQGTTSQTKLDSSVQLVDKEIK